eukprot:EG_transcript_46203
MKGRGGKGKGGKGGGWGRRPEGDEAPKSRDEAQKAAGPFKMYPDHPKLPKPQPLTDTQRSLLTHCREMETRFQKSNPWLEDNVARRLGVARWSDRFRAQDAGNFLLQLIPTEQYFP